MKRAAIFDMNGVIVNDERIHQESWRQLCQKYGFHLSEAEFKTKVFGRTEKDTLTFLFQRQLSETEVAEYSAERVEIAIALYRPQITLTDGLAEFLEQLAAARVPIAVATSARIPYTNFVMETLKIRHYFQAIVTAEDITKGKPDPEIYLKAAAAIQIEPTACVAFEDSVSGIRSAKAADMTVIGITTTHSGEELKEADRVIGSFKEVKVAELFATSLS